MIAGKRYYGLQTDIWSSGVILYASICGYLPFEDPDMQVLFKKILNGNFLVPDFVSSQAKDLLKCLLHTNPDRRYTIEKIRSHPWYVSMSTEKIPQGIIIGKDAIPVY